MNLWMWLLPILVGMCSALDHDYFITLHGAVNCDLKDQYWCFQILDAARVFRQYSLLQTYVCIPPNVHRFESTYQIYYRLRFPVRRINLTVMAMHNCSADGYLRKTNVFDTEDTLAIRQEMHLHYDFLTPKRLKVEGEERFFNLNFDANLTASGAYAHDIPLCGFEQLTRQEIEREKHIFD